MLRSGYGRACRQFVAFFSVLFLYTVVGARGAMATDYGAVTSGTWSNALTWTPSSSFPGSGDNAYIGSTYPNGSAGAESVTLGGSQSVNNLDLGFGSATSSGTLNLAGNHLTVNGTFFLGSSGGSGTVIHNGGSFSTPNLSLNSGNSLTLGASDTVTSTLTLNGSSQLTTASSGNVTGSVSLESSSTLTLGAAMALSSNFTVGQYSTLNMAGHALSAATVFLGQGIGPVTVLNNGPLTASTLNVAYGTFNFSASDSVGSLILSNSGQATTAATGNVSSAVSVGSSSTLTLGAAMTLSSNFDLEQYSTLNMAGHPLSSAATVLLGWNDSQPVTVLNRGPITAATLDVSAPGQTFNLVAADAVTNFNLNGGTTTLNSAVSSLTLSNSSQAATTLSGSVTGSVTLGGSSTLTLGAAMALSGNLNVGPYSTLNMAGHALSAATVFLGQGIGPVTVLNNGPLTASTLNVASGSVFNFSASDSVGTLNLSNSAQATTAATGNVTGSVTVGSSSTLTLGAAMTLSSNLDLEQYSTLNMAGHALSAPTVFFGAADNQPVTVLNGGAITANTLDVSHGTATIGPNSAVQNQISLAAGSLVHLLQPAGQTTGLTLAGASSSDLAIAGGSSLDLEFGADSLSSWTFRWADPTNGNWENTLTGLIGAGEITIESPNGYYLGDQGGYTYINAVVPEPGSLALLAAGMAGLLAWRWKRSAGDR